MFDSIFFQFILPAIVHINHQPFLERGDGPIVSELCICFWQGIWLLGRGNFIQMKNVHWNPSIMQCSGTVSHDCVTGETTL